MLKRSTVVGTVLVFLFALSSACAGPGAGGGSSTPAQSGQNTTIRSFKNGSATATIKVGDQTFSFTGGECSPGRTGDTIAINIGDVGGATYFGFGVGRNPGEYEASYATGARSVKGGGQFAGRYEILISIKHDGQDFSPVPESAKATMAPGLDSGGFTGTTSGGEAIAGSFKC